jgi:methylmalonyl-CoA epimerase
VRSIAEARKFYEGVLGAKFLFEHENQRAGYRLINLKLNGLLLELLEPYDENSFLVKFLATRGEGLHHLTFAVADPRARCAALKAEGVRVVDEVEWSPTSYEAFISPRSAHGVLIQIGSGYPTLSTDPEWSRR